MRPRPPRRSSISSRSRVASAKPVALCARGRVAIPTPSLCSGRWRRSTRSTPTRSSGLARPCRSRRRRRRRMTASGWAWAIWRPGWGSTTRPIAGSGGARRVERMTRRSSVADWNWRSPRATLRVRLRPSGACRRTPLGRTRYSAYGPGSPSVPATPRSSGGPLRDFATSSGTISGPSSDWPNWPTRPATFPRRRASAPRRPDSMRRRTSIRRCSSCRTPRRGPSGWRHWRRSCIVGSRSGSSARLILARHPGDPEAIRALARAEAVARASRPAWCDARSPAGRDSPGSPGGPEAGVGACRGRRLHRRRRGRRARLHAR